jgi:hypothetical protein
LRDAELAFACQDDGHRAGPFGDAEMDVVVVGAACGDYHLGAYGAVALLVADHWVRSCE